jgi:hypothetical protein
MILHLPRRGEISFKAPGFVQTALAGVFSVAFMITAVVVRIRRPEQDGFRDKSSKQNGDLIEGHWKMRSFSRRGSIDHTICSLSCKSWHQLSTVAVELLPVSG